MWHTVNKLDGVAPLFQTLPMIFLPRPSENPPNLHCKNVLTIKYYHWGDQTVKAPTVEVKRITDLIDKSGQLPEL